MPRPLRALSVPLLCSVLAVVAARAYEPSSDEREARTFEFVYEVELELPPEASGPVHVFIPLPRESERQTVHATSVDSPIPGVVETEPAHGNRFWHGSATAPRAAPLQITVRSTVSRSLVSGTAPTGAVGPPTDEERARFARYLGPNSRVVVQHEILEPIQAELRSATPDPSRAARARGIYDWVVDNLEYKKVGSGWGNGDTFWACNERYGNCTDFHALFISLARSEGIPARFDIGFPVPDDRTEGEIGGYHCWVEFHLPGSGWFPIDASEAHKHPERRELFYGTQPPDRIHFTTGRDLRLGPDHRGAPLNYFVYPYVEVDGAPWDGPIGKRFRYRERATL